MAKGAIFERKVAKHLSLWWTMGKHDDTIWRTSQSGGRATTRRRQGKRTSGQAGDLCSTDPASRGLFRVFGFELKVGYQHVTINDFIDRPEGHAYQKDGWDGWIDQATAAMDEASALSWMIIHQRSRGSKRPMVYINVENDTRLFRPVMDYLVSCPHSIHVTASVRRPPGDKAGGRRYVDLMAFRFETLFGKYGATDSNTGFLEAVRAAAKLTKEGK